MAQLLLIFDSCDIQSAPREFLDIPYRTSALNRLRLHHQRYASWSALMVAAYAMFHRTLPLLLLAMLKQKLGRFTESTKARNGLRSIITQAPLLLYSIRCRLLPKYSVRLPPLKVHIILNVRCAVEFSSANTFTFGSHCTAEGTMTTR
jgi:hypothetical protein